MIDWTSKVMRYGAPAVGAYAVLMMWVAFIPVFAQSDRRPEREGGSLDRRVEALEDLRLDHRLTVLETIQQDQETALMFSRLSMGGTGLLVAEAVIRALKNRKQ